MQTRIRRLRKPVKSHPRRGSLYMTVVITAAIVSMLALSSLLIHGVNRKAYAGQSDVIEARINAETAVRMAFFKMATDSDWRYNYPSGDWEVDTPFGNGTFTINVVDDDGDLSDDPTESVIVTGTGSVGSSIQNISSTFSTKVEAVSALQSVLHAQNDLKFASVEVSGTGKATANDDSDLTGSSQVGLNVSAADQVNGVGYLGETLAGADPLTMPTSEVLSYYKDNGTWLSISDIVTAASPPPPAPLLPPNKLVNEGFETGLSPWYAWLTGYSVAQSNLAAHSGTYGCRVTGRSHPWEGPVFNITSFIKNGTPYDASAWVRPATACDYKITIRTNSSGWGDRWFEIGWTPATSNWNNISATLVPEWSGTLHYAELYIETNHTGDFDVDDITLIDPEEGATPTGDNVLLAGDMESNPLTHWYSPGATIETSPTIVHTGANAIKAVSRNNVADTLAQDITAVIDNGATYHSEAWVRQSTNGTNVRLSVKLTRADGSVEFVPLTPWRLAPANVFVRCYGQETVSWTGNVVTAEFLVENQSNQFDNIRLDDAALIEVSSAPPPPHTIYRSVLSPTNNPFGSGQTNADGIYVIDCQHNDLFVQESRIVGTLVLLNPGSESAVLDGAVTWSPAHGNFPALLVEGDFKIEMNNDGLNESILDANFNPVGTAYPLHGANSDADKMDTYLSGISGLIYATGDLSLGGHTVIDGTVLAGNDLIMTSSVTATYSAAPLQNPPPGFAGEPKIDLIENSIRKSFD